MYSKKMWCGVASMSLMLGSAVLTGCNKAVVSDGKSMLMRNGNTGSQNNSNRAAATVVSTPLEKLTPLQSGPGLVVFEPTTNGTNSSTTAFGTGCTRWLHVVVAGLPEMGQTPTWTSIDDARRELKLSDLRLKNLEAVKLSAKVGTPYFVTSSITGNASKSVLKLQLWKAQGTQSVGSPLLISGTQASIVAALPGMARNLARQMNIKSANLPAKVGATGAELAYTGAMPWKPRTKLSPEMTERLWALAPRLPQAGILLWYSSTLDNKKIATRAVQTMLKSAPQNALLYGTIGWMNARFLAPHRTALTTLRKRYPNNFLLTLADTSWYRYQADRANQRRQAEWLVRCAPQNFLAWDELSDSYSDEAEDIRHGRFANKVSFSEWSSLNPLYAQAFAASQKGAKIDPTSAYALYKLAGDATFAGDETLADTALWQSLDSDPTRRATYEWGYEMYQPKWNNQPQKLLALAKLMSENAGECDVPVDQMISAFASAGMEDQKVPFIRECFERAPNNAEVVYNMGTVLHYNERTYRKAEKYYLKAMQLDPYYGRPYTSLGDLTLWVKNDPRTAERLYRTAINLNPDDPWFYCNLARCLLKEGRRAEAVKLAETASSMNADPEHPIFSELEMS